MSNNNLMSGNEYTALTCLTIQHGRESDVNANMKGKLLIPLCSVIRQLAFI